MVRLPEVGRCVSLSPDGRIRLYPIPGVDEFASLTRGPDGAVWFTNPATASIGRITTRGAVTTYPRYPAQATVTET